MDEFSLIEIITIVAVIFGCSFALIRTGTAPRQVWRTPAAAIGAGLLALGTCGTTQVFLSGLAGVAGGSEATREMAFNEILESAYRPLAIGVFGLLFFWMALRSSAIGDDDKAPVIADPAARVMISGAVACLIGLTAFHVGFILRWSPELQYNCMLVTLYVGLFTVLVCAIGGVWALLSGNAWQPDEA